MSLKNKTWKLRYERKAGESLWTSLLNARGIENPGDFFSDSTLDDLHDPFLFPDMGKAVHRLEKAIESHEPIVVYGDYDVDGISGAALLVQTLRHLLADWAGSDTQVSYRIPHRLNEGYGLHQSYVDDLLKEGVKVLITVDLGISCKKEVDWAMAHGLDVILTDHHSVPAEIPNAFAILHPLLAREAYPFSHLSGSGVAFKLASALLEKKNQKDWIQNIVDLASLGTVADMVSLRGENRHLLRLGLKQMAKTRWEGLRAIMESAGVFGQGSNLELKISAESIGFQIGPRLNASGRMDSPDWAIQTLLAEGDEAREKAARLEALNLERRHRSLRIFEEIRGEIFESIDAPILIAQNPDWSSGLLGLVAGRLQEEIYKPVILIQQEAREEASAVGSVRSVSGFHAVEALQTVSDLLQNFGGHEKAAGFRLKAGAFQEFKKRLLIYAEEKWTKNPWRAELEIDFALNPEELNLETLERIESFAPFGMDNPEPVFLLEGARIESSRAVGAESKHLKLDIRHGQKTHSAIAFGWGERAERLSTCSRFAVSLKKNVWNAQTSLELHLVDAG